MEGAYFSLLLDALLSLSLSFLPPVSPGVEDLATHLERHVNRCCRGVRTGRQSTKGRKPTGKEKKKEAERKSTPQKRALFNQTLTVASSPTPGVAALTAERKEMKPTVCTSIPTLTRYDKK